MIIDHCQQGTDEWHKARLGVISASNFDKIMTPALKPSSQANDYENFLTAEWFRQKPRESKKYGFMQYGNDTEPDARDAYEFITGNDTEQVGFVYRDDEKVVGCSPDSLLLNMHRGLEIKCPQPEIHLSYFLNGEIPKAYIAQVQGSMYVTGYDEWDFMSYHPEYPPLIVTVKRNEEYITELHKLVEDSLNRMMAKRKRLEPYR